MAAPKQIDLSELKTAARGRWLEIFSTLAGVVIEPGAQRRHGPCPKCGGRDRFRVIDADAGALYCNQCFAEKNGDGVAALQWLTGKTFKETVKTLRDYLGLKARRNNKSKAKKDDAQTPKVFATPQGLQRYHITCLARQHGRGVRFVKAWAYDTFYVLRYDLPTPAGEKQRKEFRPVHHVPLGSEGALGWAGGYPDGPRPVYRKRHLEASDSDLVTIHGGEKAADAAARLGLLATCNAGGEKAIEYTDWAAVLRFATVVIVIDNDPAGEIFGARMAAKLKQLKDSIAVKIVRLPNLPPKGDIVEWIAAGGTKEQFLEIVAATEAIDRPPAVSDVQEADDDPHRLARVFLDQYPHKLVYWRREYWRWDGFYRPLSAADLRCQIIRAIKEEFDRLNEERQVERAAQGEDDEKGRNVQKVTRTLVTNVLLAVESLILVDGAIDQQAWIDGTNRPNCVTMKNTIVDLDAFIDKRSDWNLPHSPNWFSPICLPYDLNPEAECPTWERVLWQNLEGDVERISILQEWAGLLLTHDTSYQKFMVLEGEGSNGKSVYCAGLVALLGRANVSHVPLEQFGQRFTLATTLGRLANIAAECGELDRVSEGYLKSFTSGDRMMFEKKGLQPFEAMPTARLLLSANNRPRFSDRSSGLWRRMIVIPFNREVPPEERILGMDKPEWWEKSGELPGIFCWAVLGLCRLRQQGRFTDSKLCQDTLDQYRNEVNPARNFLSNNCRENDSAATSCNDLYDRYAKWCHGNGYHPLGEALFGKEVKRVFKTADKKRLGGRGDRFTAYQHLELIESDLP
jgi:P4 family phage/plasmid primase-like protien